MVTRETQVMAEADLFVPKGEGRWPAILVIPILGRLAVLPDLWVERSLARFFAARGMAGAVLHRPFFEWDSASGLDQVDRYLAQTVERAERVIEELSRVSSIDAGRVGVLGMSFGAVVGALLAQKGIARAHVLALGGANLAKVLASSRDPLVRSYFCGLLKATGLGTAELIRRLGEVFTHDPLRHAPPACADHILFIDAAFDRVVMPCYAKALWASLARPRKITLPLGHYTTLLALPILRHIALRFFRGML